ncbi:MAG: MoxR family ATPase, partial [Prosthecobacter sp.]
MSDSTDTPPPAAALSDQEVVEMVAGIREKMMSEVGKVIVGQHEVIDQMLIALMAGGHCLITGAPGLAKTLLVKTVADVFDLSFNRIQFTPDLMPS